MRVIDPRLGYHVLISEPRPSIGALRREMRLTYIVSAATLAVGACTPDQELTCTAQIDPAVSSILHLQWTAPEGASSSASFGLAGEPEMETGTTTETEVDLQLVGAPVDAEVTWTGSSVVDGETWTCSGTSRTGSAPSDLEPVTVEVDEIDADSSPRFLLGAYYKLLSSSYLLAFDRRGRVVWYHEPDEDGFAVQIQQTLDGSGFIYNLFPASLNALESALVRIDYTGEILEEIATPDAHHMFTQLGDGALAYQGVETQQVTDTETGRTEDWVGDTIIEISAERELTEVFNVWDWLTPTTNEYMDGFSPYRGLDWTHGNALKYDASDDTWLLSLGHAGTILEIDRPTGEPLRRFGEAGYGVEGGQSFRYQHDPSLLADGTLLMFATDPDTDTTMGVRYSIDDDAQTLTETWRYDTDIESLYLGQARLLDNGNYWISTGAGAVMREVTPEGEILWQATAPDGQTFGQFELLDSLVLQP